MSIIRIERNPTRRQLRQFGAVAAVVLFIFGYWQRHLPSAAIPLLALCGVAGGLALWSPRLLRAPFIWLSAVVYPIGFVVGEIVLASVYFLVFTPIALLFRLLRRDALDRAIDRSCASYWQESPRPRGVESYFRQY